MKRHCLRPAAAPPAVRAPAAPFFAEPANDTRSTPHPVRSPDGTAPPATPDWPRRIAPPPAPPLDDPSFAPTRRNSGSHPAVSGTTSATPAAETPCHED